MPAVGGMWVSKLSILRAHMAAGEWRAALRLAARFPQLGNAKADITRAWEAIQRPEFYASIGKDPAALIDAGIAALRRRYGTGGK